MHLPEEAFTYTLKEDLLHLNSRELSFLQGYFAIHHPTVEGRGNLFLWEPLPAHLTRLGSEHQKAITGSI
jgi:hypothetical protein